MTVGDLKRLLEDFSDDMRVMLGEEDNYKELYSVDTGNYRDDLCGFGVEIINEDDLPEDMEDEFEEVVVLSP